jgi:hypothetical protein
LAVWNEDEAGPYQTVPCPGSSWQPEGEPAREPHEYIRNGTAKLLTLFHPATGKVHIKGVTSCPNVVLHAWLKEELSTMVATLPAPLVQLSPEENRAIWESWQEGLTVRTTLPTDLPPLRMLLIWDNLAGHKTPGLLLWLFSQGILPLRTPLGGSWLNMAESIQRLLKRRALDGQHPTSCKRYTKRGSPSLLGIAEFIVPTGSFFHAQTHVSFHIHRRAFPKSEDDPLSP